ncbi:MAG: 50S ribosomal protein L27 [Candidatus Buchananbacteria bacterium RIFCSPHIGHO2_02_FULL_40_13]|uniref:Large ribosomal subunit protein bL27 n=1 Tax=Candidatus Buchananbacteria bacterium RIFCSPLOWO2_01_FULL_39_33 TaxID=1797543 RepID=A0A1G1YL05_9BACT|nr:MAG: 50S ribosomal protein L27 [Candidatus Buchananbacteria bacterium RIFCSPHIGHO2_01_FULL_40_35]OGY50887.1 MAG: 50S ribosomal protein L27 [Candidatus Buchananbacteria bacterium RIFCSPHIGHO2_02_FULL_40_13]OGY52954.1 MAG: 50S ribosomal protein L27 [Candidatus Buchananbacteria bacterium RIFCSPLOWO2_01_FULL_39_33]
MAHKKAGGSTRLGRDSNAQRLGVKLYGGERAKNGAIVVRQRGSKYRPGKNTRLAKDDSIFAVSSGLVKYTKKKVRKFNGKLENVQIISVE